MPQSAFALLSDLDSSRLHDSPGIGGPKPCVKLFATEDLAIEFAVAMIRQYAEPDEELAATNEGILEDFQWSLEGLEYFHVRPVVDAGHLTVTHGFDPETEELIVVKKAARRASVYRQSETVSLQLELVNWCHNNGDGYWGGSEGFLVQGKPDFDSGLQNMECLEFVEVSSKLPPNGATSRHFETEHA